MKRTLLIILTLLTILPASAVAREGLAVSRKPIRTAVSFFRNATGDPSLDWVSWGAQDAITTDLKYLRYKAGGSIQYHVYTA